MNQNVGYLVDSPKPPPSRITLLFPVLNNARNVYFVACGSGKAEMLFQILNVKNMQLPCTRVSPTNGKLNWFVDRPAAAQLQ